MLYGLLLGVFVFFIANSVEFIIQLIGQNNPKYEIYVTSYSIDGNIGNQVGFLFFVFCIIGNIINVVMEEGMFRGLFIKLTETNHLLEIKSTS